MRAPPRMTGFSNGRPASASPGNPITSPAAAPPGSARQTCLAPGRLCLPGLRFINGAIAPSRSISTSL